MDLGAFIVGFTLASLLYEFFIRPLASFTYSQIYYMLNKRRIDAYYKEVEKLIKKDIKKDTNGQGDTKI